MHVQGDSSKRARAQRSRTRQRTSAQSAAALANNAIRDFVAGRTTWTAADLAELDRLRARWHAAKTGAWTAAA